MRPSSLSFAQRGLIGLSAVLLLALALRTAPVWGVVNRNWGFLIWNQIRATPAAGRDAITDARLDQAATRLAHAAQDSPQYDSGWRALGFIKLAQGDEQEAIAAWQQAGEMARELIRRGLSAETDGVNQEALSWYLRATQVAPQTTDAWSHLGLLYEKMGDRAAAVEAYASGAKRSASEQFGRSDLYHRQASTMRLLSGATDWEAILAVADAAARANDFRSAWNRVQLHALRGEALRELNRPVEAAQAYAQVLAEQPEDYWANVHLGNLIWELERDSARSEKLFLAALETRQDNKWAYRGLAEIYLAEGRHEEALALYETVLRLDPNDAIAGARKEELNRQP
jgi:tetratricopeptide (TPR) repeat protein